jgi:hypothetical protein
VKSSTDKDKPKVFFHRTIDPFKQIVEKSGLFHFSDFLAFFYYKEKFFAGVLNNWV